MTYFWSLLLTTYLVEDWAIAASLVLAHQGKLSLATGAVACFLGISSGDIILYFFGRSAHLSRRISNSRVLKRVEAFFEESKNRERMTYAIVVSRAVPGTRFFTYVSAGLIRYPAWKFLLITPISVALWVLVAFSGGRAILQMTSQHWFVSLAILLLAFAILRSWVPFLLDPWKRKTLLHSWRRWLIFEFWPAWFAYIPVVPYYIYLSLKNSSVFHPFYANPKILNGGLIGEKKWDILKHLDAEDAATLKVFLVPRGSSIAEIRARLAEHEIDFPFIAKPNIGQRGFAVRIIKSGAELIDYAEKADFEFLIQEKSRHGREAGVFYIREPNAERGELYSITDKDFPFVIGDGRTKLGDLILRDRRARQIAMMYFERHYKRLDEVVPAGQVFYLSECGNHSQGAIFIDGQHLRTEALRQKIDALAQRLPHFYFGRFDIRYANHEDLMQGRCFHIVEINGAGADVTHIYDQRTPVLEAYRVMLGQWAALFRVGKAARRLYGRDADVDVVAFLREIARVTFRKNPLSVSS